MLRRRVAAFGYAWEGIRYATRTQTNWRIHLVVAAAVVVLAALLRVQPVELAVLALTIGFVLALESVNTAVESAIDAVGGPPSFAAKCAKDCAAAAVLIGAITAVVVGTIIFGPRILAVAGVS